VQSIGGGGRSGDASTARAQVYATEDVSVALTASTGGKGGDGGNGGQPTATNTGAIYTLGVLSVGIVSQWIAGGRGIGGVSASSVSSSSKSLGDDGGGAPYLSVLKARTRKR